MCFFNEVLHKLLFRSLSPLNANSCAWFKSSNNVSVLLLALYICTLSFVNTAMQLALQNFPTDTRDVCIPGRICALLAAGGTFGQVRLHDPVDCINPPPGSPTVTVGKLFFVFSCGASGRK
jgi:hypothetical protein